LKRGLKGFLKKEQPFWQLLILQATISKFWKKRKPCFRRCDIGLNPWFARLTRS